MAKPKAAPKPSTAAAHPADKGHSGQHAGKAPAHPAAHQPPKAHAGQPAQAKPAQSKPPQARPTGSKPAAKGWLQSLEDKASNALHSAEEEAHHVAGQVRTGAAAVGKAARGAAHAAAKGAHYVADQVKAGASAVGHDVTAAAHAVEKGVHRVAGQVHQGVDAVRTGAATLAHQAHSAEHAVAGAVRHGVGEAGAALHAARDGMAHTVAAEGQEARTALRRGKKALGDHLVAAGKAVQNAHSAGDVARGLAHEAAGFGGDLAHAAGDAGSAVMHKAGSEAKHLAQAGARHLRDDAHAVAGGIRSAAHTAAQDVRDGAQFVGKVGNAVNRDIEDGREAELEGVRAVGHQLEHTRAGKALADSRVGKELKMAFGTKETARRTADGMVEDPTAKLHALTDGGSANFGDGALGVKIGKDFKAGKLGVTAQVGEKISVSLDKSADGKQSTYTVTTEEGAQLGLYGSAKKKGDFEVGAETSAGVTAGNKYVFHSEKEAADAVRLLEREQMSHERSLAGEVTDLGRPIPAKALGVHTPASSMFRSQADNIALTPEEQEKLNHARVEHSTTLSNKASVSLDTPEVDLGFYKGKVSGKAEAERSLTSRTSIGSDGQGKQEFIVGEKLDVTRKVQLSPKDVGTGKSEVHLGHLGHHSAGGEHGEGVGLGPVEAKMSVSQQQSLLTLGHTTTVGYDISGDRANAGMQNGVGDLSVLGGRPSSITHDLTAEVRGTDTLHAGHVQLKQTFDKSGHQNVTVGADTDRYHVVGGTTAVEGEVSVAGLGQVVVGNEREDVRKERERPQWASGDIPLDDALAKAKEAWLHQFSGVHPRGH